MSIKRQIAEVESVQSLRRRVEELERWFQRQDRQIHFLERERQKLSALVSNTDAGFLVLDPGLSVLWLNNVCRDWFGGSGRIRIGGDALCRELLCGSPQSCRECPAARALTGGTVSHCELSLDLVGGQRQIYATAMPIKSPDNRVDQAIVMLQDITDLEVLRRSQEALLQAKEVAEAASRAKSEFLANMSHEVRTPMTGILSMSSYLMDTPLSSEQKECVGIIQSSGESLLHIINDILDFSRIEAGRLSIEPVPFDLTTAIDEVVTLVAEKAEVKGIELMVLQAPEVPTRVVGDSGRFRQVLMNLVANAIKFTHTGHICVHIEMLGGDAAGARLRFAVEDTGIGIPTDKLCSVFEKFTQADGTITRRYGGTGLGLAIAKQLVELMGGELTVTSTEGRGSIFSFTLTLPSDPELTSLEPAGTLEGVRALVLNRHTRIRDLLVEQIDSWQAQSHGVATGREAILALRAAHSAGLPYDVAVVGCDVPDLGPKELALLIRRDPALRAMGLVLLTSLGQVEDAERLQSLGFDSYLIRPIRGWQLLNVLRTTAKSRDAAHVEGAFERP